MMIVWYWSGCRLERVVFGSGEGGWRFVELCLQFGRRPWIETTEKR